MKIYSPSKRIRGAALLILLAILALSATIMLIGRLSSMSMKNDSRAQTVVALAQAKEALIARAVLDAGRPGSLPCPDLDDDGSAELFNGNDCPAYIGRLPWRTLGLGDIRAGDGERLWYALSDSLRDHTSAQPINTNTLVNLQLDGNSGIAAIIFAPGVPLALQSGRASNMTTDYLEEENANGDQRFQSAQETALFNDQLLAITRTELFHLVTKRVLGELRGSAHSASGLLGYFANHGSFPPDISSGFVPTPVLTLDSWLTNNQWDLLATYTVSLDHKTASLSLDGLSVNCVAPTTIPECS